MLLIENNQRITLVNPDYIVRVEEFGCGCMVYMRDGAEYSLAETMEDFYRRCYFYKEYPPNRLEIADNCKKLKARLDERDKQAAARGL